MNTQTKITGFAFLLAMFGLSYGMIAQSNAKAMEEIVSKYNRIQELSGMIEEEKNNYNIASGAKQECIDSREKKMQEAHINADKHRAEIKELEGLLKSSQAQKKNKLLNNFETSDLNISGYTMNDTAEMTQDSGWFKKLMKWVDSIW